ncbi:alanine racemase [Neptunicella sp. SCSIO 80796]|uniref:alanine racemase n=1 Tax=Neptunicella plasticusilytica TaxID=3117012 RepID=UPI003A4DAF13
MQYRSRPAQAVIDLNALRDNYRLARNLTPNGQVLAVIKADAYGHGAVQVARALDKLAPAFAVACIEEALQLREAGVRQPILLLEGPFCVDDLYLAAEHQFWLMLENPAQIEMTLNTLLPQPLTIWLKIDTGMHRLGLSAEQAHRWYPKLQSCAHIADNIILTSHFACADELNNDATAKQIAQFEQLQTRYAGAASLANSAAILGWPAAAKEWNRAGIMLYGASPFMQPHPQADQLKPVMTLQSRVISVRQVKQGDKVGYGASWLAKRDSLIATVAMGYADGYPRHTPSDTVVMVNGQPAKLAGRVSMDMLGVDVTDVDSIKIGDPVVLWGSELKVTDIAAAAQTISYEVLTGISARVPRIYIGC